MLAVAIVGALGAAYVGWVWYWIDQAKKNEGQDNELAAMTNRATRHIGRY